MSKRYPLMLTVKEMRRINHDLFYSLETGLTTTSEIERIVQQIATLLSVDNQTQKCARENCQGVGGYLVSLAGYSLLDRGAEWYCANHAEEVRERLGAEHVYACVYCKCLQGVG